MARVEGSPREGQGEDQRENNRASGIPSISRTVFQRVHKDGTVSTNRESFTGMCSIDRSASMVPARGSSVSWWEEWKRARYPNHFCKSPTRGGTLSLLTLPAFNLTTSVRQQLLESFRDRNYRCAFVQERVRSSIALQIRALREQRNRMTQTQLGEKLGMAQTWVSKLENPEYGKLTVATLLRLAEAFDTDLEIKFRPFSETLGSLPKQGPEYFRVASFQEEFEEHAVLSQKDLARVLPFLVDDQQRQDAARVKVGRAEVGRAEAAAAASGQYPCDPTQRIPPGAAVFANPIGGSQAQHGTR